MSTMYNGGFIGYIINNPSNDNASNIINAVTNAKMSSAAPGDYFLTSDYYVGVIVDVTLASQEVNVNYATSLSYQHVIFATTGNGATGNNYNYNVIYITYNGGAANQDSTISGEYLTSITASSTQSEITSAYQGSLIDGAIVIGNDGSIWFYNTGDGINTTNPWILTYPYQINPIEGYDTLTSTPLYIYPGINVTPQSVSTTLTYFSGVYGSQPSSPNDGDYYVNVSNNAQLYIYQNNVWILVNISTYTFYVISTDQTYYITNAGTSNYTSILKDICGVFLSGTVATPVVTNYNNTYVLYDNTSSRVYSVWNVISGQAVALTNTSISSFVFKSKNNGLLYVCNFTTLGSNVVTVTTINSGNKLKNAMVYKYANVGFLDNYNPANLFESNIYTYAYNIEISDNTTHDISSTIPTNAIDPVIITDVSGILSLSGTAGSYILTYNGTSINPGNIATANIAFWVQGQKIFNIYILNKDLTPFPETVIANYAIPSNSTGDSEPIDVMSLSVESTYWPPDLSNYQLISQSSSSLNFGVNSRSTFTINYSAIYPSQISSVVFNSNNVVYVINFTIASSIDFNQVSSSQLELTLPTVLNSSNGFIWTTPTSNLSTGSFNTTTGVYTLNKNGTFMITVNISYTYSTNTANNNSTPLIQVYMNSTGNPNTDTDTIIYNIPVTSFNINSMNLESSGYLSNGNLSSQFPIYITNSPQYIYLVYNTQGIYNQVQFSSDSSSSFIVQYISQL